MIEYTSTKGGFCMEMMQYKPWDKKETERASKEDLRALCIDHHGGYSCLCRYRYHAAQTYLQDGQ